MKESAGVRRGPGRRLPARGGLFFMLALALLVSMATPVFARGIEGSPAAGLAHGLRQQESTPEPTAPPDGAPDADPTPAPVDPTPPEVDPTLAPEQTPVAPEPTVAPTRQRIPAEQDQSEMGAPPQITAIEIYSDPQTSLPALSLNPMQSYWVKITVSDSDGIGDLTRLTLKWWYSSGDDAGEGAFHEITTADSSTAQIFAWERSANQVLAAGGSTWPAAAGFPGLPTVEQLEDPLFTIQDFVLEVKVGKAAHETGDTGRWQVAAQASDRWGSSAYAAISPGRAMNWYGEIVVPEATVDWGAVQPGLDFTDSAAHRRLGVNVTYIANGDYAAAVRAQPVWYSVDGSHTVTLSDEINGPDQFSLRATIIEVVDILRETVPLPEGGLMTAILDYTGTATGEQGRRVDTHSLYLSLSDTITHPGKYCGTITYLITNR